MGIKIEWVGFAEGSALDSRQAVTLVGFNQVMVAPEEFPHKWQSQVIVVAPEVEDDSTSGAKAHIAVTIKDPNGEVVASVSNFVNVDRRHKEVPALVIMAVFVALDMKEAGRYEVEAAARERPDGPATSTFTQYLYALPAKNAA